MSRLVRVVLCAALVGVVGCKEDKLDNSKNQTPNDAPIGAPKSVGGLQGREAKLEK